MRFVVTVMVRDEIDIVAAMIEHTLAQEPDMIVATDNGSIDGTAEVLQRYADRGLIDLHHDPVHRKQQHAVVTGMARRARTKHAADWVVNADADEFWVPVDRSLTLRQALERTPLRLNAFTVPVVNLIGAPAQCGSGIDRLIWRDHRTDEQLQTIGIFAQPTPNAVHRGEPDVEVAQGNHFVSIPSNGQPDGSVSIEVMHLPWRSWNQFEQKVRHAGRAYSESPGLRPSRNHHGMKDYRRLLAGRLREAYFLRQPTEAGLREGDAAGWFVHDTRLRDHLHLLLDRAVFPDLLEPLLDSSKDEPFDDAEIVAASDLGRKFHELEIERDEALAEAAQNKKLANRLAKERDEARALLRQHQQRQPENRPFAVRAESLARRAVQTGRKLRRG